MIRNARGPWAALVVGLSLLSCLAAPAPPARGDVTQQQVETAIRRGIAFLHQSQNQADGSWPGQPGMTELVTLALLTAGESPDERHVARALRFSGQFGPNELNNTYAIALQTMAFAAADPVAYRRRIAINSDWLEQTQIRGNPQRPVQSLYAGSWGYKMGDVSGDNSNSQYALLGLNAAAEAGVPIRPEVWALARLYWQHCQQRDGGWQYRAAPGQATGSMTCAGVASLIFSGSKRFRGHEVIVGDQIRNCGRGEFDPHLRAGIDWLGSHFSVQGNPGMGGQWHLYYLYGLERAGRLTGLRFLGGHDWYREGAEQLVNSQENHTGMWSDSAGPQASTAFALLFLAKGRSPVLVNKLRHGGDWNNDADDVRNLVNVVSRDWKHLLTWQIVDPERARVEDLLQAPILFFNGHQMPEFGPDARERLREYVEQGGFLFADACCGEAEFDRGFRLLMKEVFPEPEYALHELPEEHAVWRSRWRLSPEVHPLWGIEHGCRTVVMYSPRDLSCFWNQMESQAENPSAVKAVRVGQNVIDYATGRELPADKLAVREVTRFGAEPARRGALHIAKLRHGGDWNIAPLAIPNLTTALRDKLGFDVVINHREILPSDPNLINYPLIYIHGRAALSFSEEDMARLRRHLEPGGGTIFADAACGSPAFDAAFRRFVAELLPDHPLEPIPKDDDLYTKRVGYDLSDVDFTRAAGGRRGLPQLEGVKLNGHWAILYSKLDIGCALERHQGADCRGYTHESALKIAANIVIYSTLP